MDGVELAPGLLCAAVGLALSFAPTGRVLVSGPAALLAEEKIARAAADSDLLRRAEDSTRELLTGLAGSFGYEEVTVRFEPAPGT